MRVVVIDTNVVNDVKAVFPLEVMKPCFKSNPKITLLWERTNEEDVKNIEQDNIIGYVDHITLHKGVFRGDVSLIDVDDETLIEVDDHFENGGTLHLSLEIKGTKDNDVITLTEVIEVYYAYLKDLGEE